MHVIAARNVNDAYQMGLEHIWTSSYEEDTRAGVCLVANTPVTTVYERPTERVLFDEARDANPFFHLFESIWMLAGRRDATWLDRFVSDFSSRFAEPDGSGNAHGAYGYRWRHAFSRSAFKVGPGQVMGDYKEIDQIIEAGRLMREDPKTRRVVIQMWDAEYDLGADKRDLPCNTQIMLKNRGGFLDFTVTNRSNDIVWGAYGANAVHMSFLHEVLAALCELEVGVYYQMSNNYHMYREHGKVPSAGVYDPYELGVVRPLPLVASRSSADALQFIQDCGVFCDEPAFVGPSPWFSQVAHPMLTIHNEWKNGDIMAAFSMLPDIRATDWRKACSEWMLRRLDKREQRQTREK